MCICTQLEHPRQHSFCQSQATCYTFKALSLKSLQQPFSLDGRMPLIQCSREQLALSFTQMRTVLKGKPYFKSFEEEKPEKWKEAALEKEIVHLAIGQSATYFLACSQQSFLIPWVLKNSYFIWSWEECHLIGAEGIKHESAYKAPSQAHNYCSVNICYYDHCIPTSRFEVINNL